MTVLTLALVFQLHAAATPTTGSLRLGDLFSAPTVVQPWRGGDLSFDPNGPVILVPDASAWRLPPPTPTPTPEAAWIPPEGLDLPSFSMLPNPELSFLTSLRQPALEFQGIEFTQSFPGEAEITFETGFSQLRVEYRLVNEGNPDAPLVFYHAPRSAEKFRVPAGRWHLEWRAWRREEPLREVRRVFPPQPLVSSGMYRYSAPTGDEAAILLVLRRGR